MRAVLVFILLAVGLSNLVGAASDIWVKGTLHAVSLDGWECDCEDCIRRRE